MTDKPNLKLQEFEAKLRCLKPYRTPPPSRPPRDWKRIAAYLLATAATAIAVVCWTAHEPGTIQEKAPGYVASSKIPAIRGALAPTMRQQLRELLAEMEVAHPVPEKKPIYPVVEIAVCTKPPRPSVSPPLERLRLRFDERELSMF